ncbi:GntR family transcriptional regulator [Saccharopolyspora phatthalungensis]|uniref:DNA-binding GntR family transcriptional regulator n=1 Tax=Saccharopolyspora phatthalungensis TaxID=664693 RepID=A0A840QII2_9PSEU|nr:GntR family transcriptional regulator [Saccharopolyspora phatthalungensis]MBB5159940.1 DNA-binding GntR family transcriptional regulator [Saccharopolyspora phatthalungensis]
MGRLETISVTTLLVDTLRAQILDGKVESGRGLAENDVAAEYEVSRPTARVAITQLVQEGLLRRNGRQQPARVPQLTAADVEDLFVVRLPLELEVVRLVAGRPDAHGRAARAVDDLRAIDSGRPHSAFVEADLRFHRALVDAIGSPRMTSHYERLSGEIHLSMVQSRLVLGRDRIVAEHSAILAAIVAGDVARAHELMESHLAGARDAMVASLGADSLVSGQ